MFFSLRDMFYFDSFNKKPKLLVDYLEEEKIKLPIH